MASYGGAGSALANELPDTVDGLLWRMRGELTCPICLQMLSEATSTPCGHTFCQECIHQALRSGMTGCPVCKQPVHRRRLYDASSVDLIVHEFLQLRAAYEQESGHDLSQQVPAHDWRADPISDLSQQFPYPTKEQTKDTKEEAAAEAVEANEEDGPIPQTVDTDATDVTSLEIRQGGERDQQQQEHLSCEHIIACTGIQDNNVHHYLNILTTRLPNVRRVQEISEEVTCMVVGADVNRRAHRTIKYMQAMLMGKIIVSQDWITACYEQGQMVPTNPYQVLGDTINYDNVLERAREDIAHGNKLFQDTVFYLHGSYTQPTQEQLGSLITLAGGRLVSSPDALPPSGTIICTARMTTKESGRMFAKYHKHPLASAWILDSISAYRVLGTSIYRAGDKSNPRYVVG
ncbi:hypothetical protein BDB00DRAFT_431240 [Zychaea mexicana]|uniref:uncharacterized protein n=1 Tax=Zychaea mexicana TaxID=64656 RepID=UPI0022FE4749|nr:uncharacterized protein BDB00DRAFT_431240 [Zychaea mexicana]KAI9492430.1 hypothetical protein BDB00DRAFT_431240 [Zychaea mexicana]